MSLQISLFLSSGGENVRLGEAVQQDRLDDSRAWDQEDQILVICARNVFGHYCVHRAAHPLLYPDNIRAVGERSELRRNLRSVDFLQYAAAHHRVVFSTIIDNVGRDDGVHKSIGGMSLHIFLQICCRFRNFSFFDTDEIVVVR